LKRSELLDVHRIENRWYPKRILYHDLMQNGDGTEYIIDSINLHAIIAESQFTKAALKK
jgi:Outer membrane lipoprotein-sorting protein